MFLLDLVSVHPAVAAADHMSGRSHNSAHSDRAPVSRTRGTRLASKLGDKRISLKRLEALLSKKAKKKGGKNGGKTRRP